MLEPLAAVPAVATEAWIRTGLVHTTTGNHAAALHAYETAQPIATDQTLKYLAHFLAGRALEALDRHDEAIAQYKRALDIVPQAESAVVALSSLQFLHNERDASVSLIDRTFAAPATTTDPGRMIGYGYFLHWPAIKDCGSLLDGARVLDASARSEAVLHWIYVSNSADFDNFSVSAWCTPTDAGEVDFVGQSAARTGGDSHRSRFGDPAVKTFAQILDEFRQSYVLRYSPQGVASKGWHDVRVQVPAQPALTIKARSGYFGAP